MRPPRKTGGSRPPGAGGPRRPSGPGGNAGGPRRPGTGSPRAPRTEGDDRQRAESADRPRGTRPPRGDARPARTADDRPQGERPARPPRSGSGTAAGGKVRHFRQTPGGGEARPPRAERPARPARPSRPERDRRVRTDRAETEGSHPDRPSFGRAGRPAKRSLHGRPPSRSPAEARAAREAGPPIEPQRIAKLLARAGVGSRRDIERLIAEGKVALHGEVLTTPATIVASLDGITVNGLMVEALEPSRVFRFHKPAGFLTTARDPGGRPTIMDILPPGLPRVVPVGRLDMNTEGLLLLTTDGELKRALELPINAVPRRYRVRAYGEFTQKMAEALIDGLTIEGVRYGPIDCELERRTGRNLWLAMTLTEGKNREIRRVLEFLGLQVSRLIRVAYGPLELGDLPPRDADEVPDGVVASLRKGLARTTAAKAK